MSQPAPKQDQQVATTDAQIPEVRGFYSEPQALYAAFQKAAAKANLLSPVVQIDHIPAMHSISLRVVTLDPTPPDAQGRGGGGDVYLPDQGRQDELALTAVALSKIEAAAGISADPKLSGRLDDGSHPHYCHFRKAGWIVDFDGSRRCIVGEKEIDLRDGSPSTNGWSEKRLRMAREHILAMCESKARNRMIRSALAIRGKYGPADIRKPFVVPKLVFDVDQIADPEIKKVVALKLAERALGITEQLFGPSHAEDHNVPALAATPTKEGEKHEPPPVKAGGEARPQEAQVVSEQATGTGAGAATSTPPSSLF